MLPLLRLIVSRLRIRFGIAREAGIYTVFFVLLAAALLLLVCLAVGLTLVAMGSTKIQQIGNLTAMAALKGYLDAKSAASATPQTDALARANIILGQNSLTGAMGSLGSLVLGGEGTSGSLILGTYLHEDPDPNDGVAPCQPNYPCFIPADFSSGTPALPVNAARVQMHNQLDNPIIAPFAGIFGNDAFSVSASATSAVVQTCAAYLIDISFSSVNETHIRTTSSVAPGEICPGHTQPDPNCSPNCALAPALVACPVDPLSKSKLGYFAYRRELLKQVTENLPGALDSATYVANCQHEGNFPNDMGPFNPEALLWCNMVTNNSNDPVAFITRSNPQGIVQDHYPDDYYNAESLFGEAFVDGVTEPEPLRSFFLGVNAGLSLVEGRSAIGDSAIIIPFTARIRNPYPSGGTQTTNNIGLLRQLSNLDNRPNAASIAGTYPNFLTMGWLPMETGVTQDLNTDIVLALQQAITSLSTSCPNTARKVIVIFTDGLATCSGSLANSQVCTARTNVPDDYNNTWLAFTAELLTNNNSILSQLAAARISLTTVLRGADVGPNIRFELNPDSGAPYSAKQLHSVGWAYTDMFDWSSTGGGAQAYVDVGNVVGSVFREPNLYLGQLSIASGGNFCPILDQATTSDCPACGGTSCYEDDGDLNTKDALKQCARPPAGSFLRYAFYGGTASEIGSQSAECVAEGVGGNAFMLVEN